MRVALFIPCFVDLLAPDVGMATAQLLQRLGHDVHYPEGQTCCGQPALNAGHTRDAACLAKRLLDLLDAEQPEAVVAPSGSCVAALRVEGRQHLGLDHDVLDHLYELTEFLTGPLGLDDVGASFDGTVTWHDACHALRGLGVRDGPRTLLAAVRGLSLVEMASSEECCGFGGAFAVKMPETSAGIGMRKVRAIEASGAAWVASSEVSCLMQIDGLLKRRRSPVRTIHVAQILAGATA